MEYQMLLQRLQSGGQWYESRQAAYGYPNASGNDLCLKICLANVFCNLCCGGGGLIHISQIADRRIEKPGDVLTEGEMVDAKITAIDEEKHKVSLSIRALSEPAPAPVKEEPVEEEEVGPEADALVYEVSATGEATGIAPEEE